VVWGLNLALLGIWAWKIKSESVELWYRDLACRMGRERVDLGKVVKIVLSSGVTLGS